MDEFYYFIKNLLILENKVNKYKLLIELNDINDNLLKILFYNKNMINNEDINVIFKNFKIDKNINIQPFLNYLSDDYESSLLKKNIFENYLKIFYKKEIPKIIIKKQHHFKLLLKIILNENKLILYIRKNMNENVIYFIENVLFENNEFKSFDKIYLILKEYLSCKEEIVLIKNRLFGFIGQNSYNIIKFRINLNKMCDNKKISKIENNYFDQRNNKKLKNKNELIYNYKYELLKWIRLQAEDIILNKNYNHNIYK